eukprot:TRINITY_DN22762_c0_g1_i1.p1 TRINITY_DN22762_c0_g1~~TRINITY_DN22762_c0_g1_i1.p1  ORF type:complete len:508 (+),score=72.17 TRINITY_DN22762_c0_g1_i1:45-1568(+)
MLPSALSLRSMARRAVAAAAGAVGGASATVASGSGQPTGRRRRYNSSIGFAPVASSARAEAMPRDAAPLGWIIADMDGTLVGKPGFVAPGRYEAPTLADSPCLRPLCRWLRAGGRLVVVTSDDGDGPVRRVLSHIPAELLPRVLFSTSDGAALFRCREDRALSAVEGYGAQLRLPSDKAYLHRVYAVAQRMHSAFFADLAEDPALFDSLDETLRGAYRPVLDAVASGETTLEETFGIPKLLLPGRVKPVGTMITRKQAGPSSHWISIPPDVAVGGGGGIPPKSMPKGWTPERWLHFERSCCPNLVAPFTCVILLGMPNAFSEKYCQLVAAELAELGLVASRAPNSVWLKPPGADKAVRVRWLQQCGRDDREKDADGNLGTAAFRLRDSVALGDMPLGNDGPLANLATADGLTFVSVGADPPPAHGGSGGSDVASSMHAPGWEHGTAAVIEVLADHLEREVEAAESTGRFPRRLGELDVRADLAKVASVRRSNATGASADSTLAAARL